MSCMQQYIAGVTGLQEDLANSRVAIATSPWMRGDVTHRSTNAAHAYGHQSGTAAAVAAAAPGGRWLMSHVCDEQQMNGYGSIHANLSPRLYAAQDLVPSSYRTSGGSLKYVQLGNWFYFLVWQ